MKTLCGELDKYDFANKPNSTVVSLKQKYKELNKYVPLNDLTKPQLLNELNAIGQYVANITTDYRQFTFGDKLVTLDKEQQAIVTAPAHTHTRILACAGSGKTTTILCRIKWLLENVTTPEKILLMTFNKDACENLKNRINDLFGFNIKIEIRTIDSFSAKLYYATKETTNKFLSISEYCTLALDILKKHGHVVCRRYEYVFFDEFQDISNIQFEILKVFALNRCYLTVIGDDNQNIYQWRGSNNYYMINFDQLFSGVSTHTIVNNYRSTQHIIAIANKSIDHNINQVRKQMNPIKICTEKHLPELLLFNTTKAQYTYIVESIIKLIKIEHLQYHDFAILSRNSTQLKEFETHLSRYNAKPKNQPINYIALLTEETDNKPVIVKDHLAISTIHRSKGLEWQMVFILGLNNGEFPSSLNKAPHNVEEERRLFYVGLTRAKKYLRLVACTKELPISIFVKEVNTHLKYTNNAEKKYSEITALFFKNDNKRKIPFYPVTDVVKNVRPESYIELRTKNLLEFDNVTTKNIHPVDTVFAFNADIKKNFFEPDFGDFCDRVLTRKIMEKTSQKIYDNSADNILKTVYLDKRDMEIYTKYELKTLVLTFANRIDDIYPYLRRQSKYDGDMTDIMRIIERIKERPMLVSRGNTYPKPFLESLKVSYGRYIEKPTKSDDILKDIYYVSLCGKCSHNRRRLVYRDVYNIFADGLTDFLGRMDAYVETIDQHYLCKILVSHDWRSKEDGENYEIKGEIDCVDITNETLIDFKCSSADYKMEWLLQLLLYYCLLRKNNNTPPIKISKLSIVNIMRGICYTVDISNEYPCETFLEYMCDMVEKMAKGNMYNDEEMLQSMLNMSTMTTTAHAPLPHPLPIPPLKYEPTTLTNIMVFDTETTGLNIYEDDIIQLAYNVYSTNGVLIKKVDNYVIPEFKLISSQSANIHKITNNIINTKGKQFATVIQQFVTDMQDVKTIVGHNVIFDINMVVNNMDKYGTQISGGLFDDRNIVCTKKMSRQVLDLPQFVTLEELHTRLGFGSFSAHNAIHDVEACAKCYFSLLKKTICETEPHDIYVDT